MLQKYHIIFLTYNIDVLPNYILNQTVMQPVDIKSKSINATNVHNCYYLNENCTHSQTNPLTSMSYFITPTTNIVAIPAIIPTFS